MSDGIGLGDELKREARGTAECESLEALPLAKLLYYALTGGLLGGPHMHAATARRSEATPGL